MKNKFSIHLMIACAISTFSLAHAQQTEPKKFSIAVLPDTQYYTAESQGGDISLFESQIKWILANSKAENIAYTIHLGDITDHGDNKPKEWELASKAMYALEAPLPGLADGMPYGLAIGNHDQVASQFAKSGRTDGYNKYFGVDHFKKKSYYGGHFGSDNDSHYDLFKAHGQSFIVIYIEYDAFDEQQDQMNDWAAGLLEKYADHKAIVVCHYTLFLNKTAGTNQGEMAPFGKQASRIYNRLKVYPNLVAMLGGHVGDNGEGYRQDTYGGNTVRSFLSDYQSRAMGGNGMMRLMTFDLDQDRISIKTFSPYHDYEEIDDDSRFEVPLFRNPSGSRIYDFDGDGKSDLLSYRNGNWMNIDNKLKFSNWNAKGVPVATYRNRNGRTEPLVYQLEKGNFIAKDGLTLPFGKAGDIPVPADYDGDGIADLAVWDAKTAQWMIEGKEMFTHGWEESLPVPADYDGDGAAEIAVWRFQNNTWYIQDVGNVPFGEKGDVPVPADYNGDGRAEIAVWRPSTGEWLILGMEKSIKLGKKGDLPIPGDYFVDGKVQPAVFDPAAKLIRFYNGQTKSWDVKSQDIVNLPYVIKKYYLDLLSNAK
ncbi:FG-GAP-like repeat-containing protein [Sphingobacterium hotanense]|uniref:FG-GAP-like repeat-containing protein n=1 Tax=Sphingobacterium hotanense TaxID=649196 RepID=UPI0021A6E1F8|nr:FG-GAP-like repeat-containing protein [Sphingobacterium hotanense]MCT1525238.1 FG-GAP-like repeat-containing protein [Sphingobacterium hotanense]